MALLCAAALPIAFAMRGSRSMHPGRIRSSRGLKASTNTPEAGKLSNGRLLHDFKDVPQPYIADDVRADEDGNI
jgi:hypothetical protein